MVVVPAAVLLSWAVVCLAHPYRGAVAPRAENPRQTPSTYQKPWYPRPPPGQQWGGAPQRPIVVPYQTAKPPLDNRVGAEPPTFNSGSRNPGCQMDGKSFKVGDKWTGEGGCVRHTCVGKGKITTLGCPAAEPSSDCAVWAEDPRQPWPLCCAQPRCSS